MGYSDRYFPTHSAPFNIPVDHLHEAPDPGQIVAQVRRNFDGSVGTQKAVRNLPKKESDRWAIPRDDIVERLISGTPEAHFPEVINYYKTYHDTYPPHPMGGFSVHAMPAISSHLAALEDILTTAFGRCGEHASATAVVTLQGLVEAYPHEPVALALLGYWHLQQGRTEEALELARRTLIIQSHCLHALWIMGEAYKKHGGLDDPNDAQQRNEAALFQRDTAQHFCPVPFTELITTESGDVNTCCAALVPVSIGNLYTQSWEEVWNSPAAQEVRRSILDGEFKYCNRLQCPHFQANSLPKKSEVDDPVLRDIIDNHKTRLDTPPKLASLGHDASCNLSCPQCRTGLIVAKGEKMDQLERANEDFVLPLVRNVEEIVVTNSGDPFASKHFRRFMSDVSREKYPRLAKITLLTNGLLFTPREWQKFANLHYLYIQVVVSVDAAKEETYREVRRRGNFARLQENLRFISALRGERRIQMFHLRFCVQTCNFAEIPEFVRWAKELGVDLVVFTKLMNTGTYTPDEFAARSISDRDHPRNAEFLATLRAPVLAWDNIHWDNLAAVREEALRSGNLASPQGDDLAAVREEALRSGNLASAQCAASRLYPCFDISTDGLEEWRHSASFQRVRNFFEDHPKTSLVSADSRALLYHIVVALRPRAVLEIGTYHAGTTEVLAQALWEAGGERLDTIDPYQGEIPRRAIANLPPALRERVRFHAVASAAFLENARSRGRSYDLTFIDGDHEFEAVYFDLLCCARLLRPGGVIVLACVDQPGPKFAARSFVHRHPDWIDIAGAVHSIDPSDPFRVPRTAFPGTMFYVLRSPPHYVLSEIPRSFGSLRCDGRGDLQGIALKPAATAQGVVHVQSYCRTFGPALPREEQTVESFPIDLAEADLGRTINLNFSRKLNSGRNVEAADTGNDRRIEIILAFTSENRAAHLALSHPPVLRGVTVLDEFVDSGG